MTKMPLEVSFIDLAKIALNTIEKKDELTCD